MNVKVLFIAGAWALIFAAMTQAQNPAPQAPANPEITQAADRSVAVTARGYAATVDTTGRFSLTVGGAAAFQQVFMPEAGVPLTVHVVNHMVAVRSGKHRVEYTFDADTLGVVTEGFEFTLLAATSLKAVLATGNKGGAFGRDGYANTYGLVLDNGLTVTYSIPFHVGTKSDRRIVPSYYCNGSKKAGNLLEFTFKPGPLAEVLALIGQLQIQAIGNDWQVLRKDGNQSGGITYFSLGDKVAFKTAQTNLADKPFELTYAMTVLDHYVAGKTVFSKVQTVKLDAGKSAETPWTLPALAAGFYYLTVEAKLGDKAVSNERLAFAVDLLHYTHPLTRPTDFTKFWKTKVDAMRKLPFDAVLTPVAEKSTEVAVWYDMELMVAGGKRLKTVLQTPRAAGKFTGRMSTKVAADDGESVSIGFPLPEMATFNRWTSADDNNMVECYLLALRLTDYLRSRADVDKIYLFGASRTGPIQFVNAALDPTRVAAVDIHVPTSAGIGWQDKPYYAWGLPAGYKPDDSAQVRRFTTMAAYCDPVNFAPDMKVPWITAYGILDDLARPEGIEVMFQLSPAPWKHISRDGGGHQYSPGFQQLQKDLAAYLKTGARTGSDDKVMKEH
jgi:cephalosporin-C deacetylase-like acetyl esterase